MSGVLSHELKAYFDEAQRWDADRLREARRARAFAWAVAGAATLLAAAAVTAVAALAPLKSVAPFVVRVDRETGAVDVLTALSGPDRITRDEAVAKYFLAQYVRARAGWLPPAAEAQFREVSILSTPAEQQRWAEAFRPANPASPQVALGPAGEADVQVRAISFVAPGVAEVRFHRLVRQGGQASADDWIATLAYAWSAAPMAEADRLRNPLGFQVTSYRADPEVAR